MTIGPDEVHHLSLEEVLGNDEDYRYTKDMVYLNLFSHFPERQKWALGRLREAWRNHLVIDTVTDNDTTYCYLRFDRTEKYFLVSTYRKDIRAPEPAPSPKEMAQWEEYAHL